jgi:hypothetical protein
MAYDEYIVVRRSGPDGDGCLTASVCLVLFGLYVWFRSWFDDYAPHSPLFRFIGAFYHYTAVVPWRAYCSVQPTPYPRVNFLLGGFGLIAIPALLLLLSHKQPSFSKKTQAQLNGLWIVLRIALWIFIAPIVVGIVWLITLGIWNLLLLLGKWLFEKA